MSESQYSLGEEASDEDYDNSSERKPRPRQVKTPRNYQAIYREPKPVQEKRLTRRKINPLPKDISYNEEDQEQIGRNAIDVEKIDAENEGGNQIQDEDEYSMFNLQIGLIIWRRQRANTDEDQYLIKFRGKSYLHVEWLTQKELMETVKSPKNKINRFNKTFQKRLLEGKYDEQAIEQEKYFDPCYLEVDRILTATELFPIIHQKKANEIKGKWSETLMIVCSKLLNFTRNKIHYGTPFCEPVNPERDNCPDYFDIVKSPMDLGTVLNKIYLDIYKNSNQFWHDIGLVWKNCLKYNKTENSDLRVLGLTLRECSIFLYDQWYHLCEQRYHKLLEEFPQLVSEVDIPPAKNEGQDHRMDIETLQNNNGQVANNQANEEKDEKMNMQNSQNKQKTPEMNGKKNSQNDENKDFQSQNDQQPKYGQQNEENENINYADDSSSEKPSSKKKQEEDEEREYLNMDEFYEKNIFLTDKKVQNPTSHAQLQLLNPGQFTYAWLDEESGDGKHFLSHSYEYIDRLDMKRLDLNIEVDRLYMVKWKNLSYSEATWELQSVIGCPDKIAEFKNINKALGKDARTLLDSQRQKHIYIRDFQLNRKKRFNTQQINDMKTKLYFYDVASKKQPHQYNVEHGPIYKHQKILRSYQVESLNWVIRNWYQKKNMILADQMGLGKTIQSISFLYHLFSVENVKGPFLIIAPLSTLQHWKRTVEDWTHMNCVLYYDQNGLTGRRSIQYYQWHHINITMKGLCQQSQLNKFQILITSYEVFMLDFQTVILDIPFQFVIVDQAHRLKNKNAKILTSLKQLPCKRVLLLTGTPIQNNTSQLWSLLNYIHPQKFSSHEMFKRQFGDLSNNQQLERLAKVIKPYMLRRMKEDVEQSIPPLVQTIIDVQMTNFQKTIYRALYEKNKNLLVKGVSGVGQSAYHTNLNNLELQLRKCCNHPCLIKQIEDDILPSTLPPAVSVDKILNGSGKMVFVSKLLEKCRKEGQKVLIFSQFTHMLKLIQQFLKFYGYRYQRIDGQIKAKQRQIAIDKYNNPTKNRQVFLLSTKAGGVGINLTSANVVIIYDSDWNPQNDVQATARAHRIGQKNEVKVYRLITSNTYQTQMFQRATQKLGLDKAIFIGGHFKDSSEGNACHENKISKEEMEILLKKGMLGFLQAKENKQFFEANVDEIIANNSRIAKYSVINGSCTFEKKAFTSNQANKDLDMYGTDFWKIVFKDVDSASQTLLKKIKNPLTDLKDYQVQKQLMYEASILMNALIQSKLNLTNFNADDEINLSEFLTIVNSQRQFHRQYRDNASAWLEEICKPSRRWKKLVLEDFEIADKKGVVKKSVNTRTEQKDGDIFVDEQRQDQQIEQSQERQKLPNEQKKQEMLKKLCCFCQHPKCTFHCKSFCKRCFHVECRKKVQQQGIASFEEYQGKLEISQLCKDQQALKQVMKVDFICNDCKNNSVSCFICKKKGFYYGVEYQKNKKTKGKPNVEEKEVTPKNKKKNQVTKCSTANCSKYFHPKCVQTYLGKDHFKYIDSNSLHFRCSLHYCDKCGVSGDTMSILQCVRCPKALHIRCMDKDKVLKLSKKQFICDAHFKNKKDLKKASERFNLTSLKKSSGKKQKSEKKKQSQESQPEKQSPKVEKGEQEVIHHSYKTRRNRGPGATQEVISKVRVVEQRKPVRVANKQKMLTYQELGITPIAQFDYENYDKDWCRYCGTRYSSNFTKGPWGSKTLCTVHYINWNTSKNLDLQPYKQKPKRPIRPESEQELKYITSYAHKHPQMTKQQIIESLEKKNQKKQA